MQLTMTPNFVRWHTTLGLWEPLSLARISSSLPVIRKPKPELILSLLANGWLPYSEGAEVAAHRAGSPRLFMQSSQVQQS